MALTHFIQGKYDEIVVANKSIRWLLTTILVKIPNCKSCFPLQLRNDMIMKGYNVGYALQRI